MVFAASVAIIFAFFYQVDTVGAVPKGGGRGGGERPQRHRLDDGRLEDRLDDEGPRSELSWRGPGEVEHDVRHGVLGVGQEVETGGVAVKVLLNLLSVNVIVQSSVAPQQS